MSSVKAVVIKHLASVPSLEIITFFDYLVSHIDHSQCIFVILLKCE